MPSEQKKLDTHAAGTYNADVSLHIKPSRCVKHLMKRAQGGMEAGSHPLSIVMDGALLRATGVEPRETSLSLAARFGAQRLQKFDVNVLRLCNKVK